MASSASAYVCQQCGAVHRKWVGRCDDCGAWNTLIEEARTEAAPKSLRAGAKAAKGRKLELHPLAGESAAPPRRITGIAEFDRVCGGGLVEGSTVLVAGDPG
ncbi:MAG: DNA repair protein RadA, partial [Proteobacteria bacterium]|nr:DNA repair protein RadA [Pseudomonadota bacterium]